MENLPREMILEILKQSSYEELNKLCTSNKFVKNICDRNEKIIYKHLLERDFFGVDYKQLYKIFTFLKKQGLNVFHKDQHFDILLEQIGDKKTLQSLLDFGININSVNNKGETLLIHGIKNDIPSSQLLQLIDLGINIDATDKKGMSALPLALIHKSGKKLIFELINNTKNINKQDRDGNTVLMLAISKKLPLELINKLIQKGADVKIKNKFDLTVLDYASNNIKPAILKVLQKAAGIR